MVQSSGREGDRYPRKVLVGIDFSSCCRKAVQMALQLVNGNDQQIVALYVIDKECLEFYTDNELGVVKEFEKQLFTRSKRRLKAFLDDVLHPGTRAVPVVCGGTPYLEINRQAEKHDVDLIVLGSCGMVGDPSAIFFGGTTERVLRFIKRPVLCVPPGADTGEIEESVR